MVIISKKYIIQTSETLIHLTNLIHQAQNVNKLIKIKENIISKNLSSNKKT